jgi:hypothetical protein
LRVKLKKIKTLKNDKNEKNKYQNEKKTINLDWIVKLKLIKVL